MDTKHFKSESIAEFLARGGKISKHAPKETSRKPKSTHKLAKLEDIDFSKLPQTLKIRFGIK